MKKLLLSAVALSVLASLPAQAQLVIQPTIVTTPAYVESPPVVYVPTYPRAYDVHHRRHDIEYWRERRMHERHEHWEHDRHR